MIRGPRTPRRTPALLQLLRSLSKNRRLLHDFVVRDLRSRYIGSSMGFFWSVVFPIINLFVYMFVFRIVLKTRWSDYQGATMVALIMLAGIVVWAAFSESMSRTTNILVDNSNLIQKVVFPSEVLPAYIVASSLINMLIAMPVVLMAVAYNIWINPETDPHTLARAADEITILDVINAVAPLERIRHCPLGLPSHTSLCPLHKELDQAYAATEAAFSRVTMGQLLRSESRIIPLCDI